MVLMKVDKPCLQSPVLQQTFTKAIRQPAIVHFSIAVFVCAALLLEQFAGGTFWNHLPRIGTKRIPILDRIFAFFTGKNRTVQALPESPSADEPKPKAPEPKASEKLTAVEPSKPTPEQKPLQPTRQPVVEPAKPAVPKPEPPKTPVPTTPETPSVPASVNKTAPVVPAPAKPAPPAEPTKVPEPAKPAPTLPKPSPPTVPEVKPKELPKPEPVVTEVSKPTVPTPAPAPKEPVPTPAPAPTPTPAPPRLVKEKKELPAPTPKSEPTPATDVPTLPTNNEDSFIIVEQQKPANKPGQKPKVDVKNSTMDFLQGESGRSAPATVATPPSSVSADR
uniref:Uncharacterized protein n=1 Tax=Anopheles culicifacies TaxID=139723 RepID=A0A182M037_9DIPT